MLTIDEIWVLFLIGCERTILMNRRSALDAKNAGLDRMKVGSHPDAIRAVEKRATLLLPGEKR